MPKSADNAPGNLGDDVPGEVAQADLDGQEHAVRRYAKRMAIQPQACIRSAFIATASRSASGRVPVASPQPMRTCESRRSRFGNLVGCRLGERGQAAIEQAREELDPPAEGIAVLIGERQRRRSHR